MDIPGLPARKAALRLTDAVLRRGETLEQAGPAALQGIASDADRALASRIAKLALKNRFNSVMSFLPSPLRLATATCRGGRCRVPGGDNRPLWSGRPSSQIRRQLSVSARQNLMAWGAGIPSLA